MYGLNTPGIRLDYVRTAAVLACLVQVCMMLPLGLGRVAALTHQDDVTVNNDVLVQVDPQEDAAWQAYMSGLQRRGYLAGAAEGTESHGQLLSEAQNAFQRWAASGKETAQLAAPADYVDTLMQVSRSIASHNR